MYSHSLPCLIHANATCLRPLLVLQVMLVFLLSGSLQEASGQTRNWQFRTPMPTARTGVSAVILDDRVYVMGGQDANGNALNVVETYDPLTNTWESGPSLRSGRYNAAAVIFEGNIVLMGGSDSGGVALKKVEIFNRSENRWESFDNMESEREGLAAVVLEGQLYAMGGSNQNEEILDSVEYFDNDDEKWEITEDWDLDIPRASFAAVAVGDFAYSFGGYSSFGPIGLTQKYHLTDGIIQQASFSPARGGLAATYFDDDIYLMGGRKSNNQIVSNVDRFLTDEDRWEPAPPLKVGRENFAAVSINDAIYVFGGMDNAGNILNSVEAYTVTVAPNASDDIAQTDEDGNTLINVLLNDSDPAGGSLAIESFMQPDHGIVSQLTTSTLSYTPEADFFGEDRFTYMAINSAGGMAQATVTVTVNPVNDPPLFTSNPLTGVAQNELYTYSISANDIDGDMLMIGITNPPVWLSLTDNQDGTAELSGVAGPEDLGAHEILVTVDDGTAVVEQSFTLTVVAGAPSIPVLLSPADGASDLPTNPGFAWNSTGASRADIQLAATSDFTVVLFEKNDIQGDTVSIEGLAQNTTYYWRVRASNAAGNSDWSAPFSLTTVDRTDSDSPLPLLPFTLHANYPNPFRTGTRISFDVSTGNSQTLAIEIYDIRGRMIWHRTDRYYTPGSHEVYWDGHDDSGGKAPSGTYILRLQLGTEQQTRLMTLIK